MHTVNHPQTIHYQTDVSYEVDPYLACRGRPVGLLHLSPDCTHHSQAAGGQPRDNATRSLSWSGKRWAAQVRPDVITLENVEQITVGVVWWPNATKLPVESSSWIKPLPPRRTGAGSTAISGTGYQTRGRTVA